MKFFSSHSIAFFGLAAAFAAACGGTATPEPPPGFIGEGGTGNAGTAGTQVGMAGTEVVPMAGSGGGSMMPSGGCDVVAEVLQASNGCAGGSCHDANSSFGGFAPGNLADFVGQPSSTPGCFLINPDDPALSTIYTRVSGGTECGGNLMPLTGDPLSADQQECLLSALEEVTGNGDTGNETGNETVGGGPSGDEPCDAPTLVFNNTENGCAGANCHDPGAFAGGFVGADPQDFVDAPSAFAGADCLFINTADIEQSMLYTRTVTGGSCGGATMPANGLPALSQEQAECLLDWLQQFAD